MKRLCIFCGSKVGDQPIYADEARKLGALMLERNVGLVFGGGHIGLMGVLADTLLAGGGSVVGVIPRGLEVRELAHRGVQEMHVVGSMHERKALMADRADAFAALPGGYGTADELFEIVTWAQLDLHAKPIALLNTANFFDPLLAWVDHTVREGFVKRQARDLLRVAATPEQLLDRLGLT